MLRRISADILTIWRDCIGQSPVMDRMSTRISDFLRDERGATAIEYGFIALLISITIIAAATQMGQSVAGFFQSASDGLTR